MTSSYMNFFIAGAAAAVLPIAAYFVFARNGENCEDILETVNMKVEDIKDKSKNVGNCQ